MTTAEGFAPAKVNLTLHVTGRRADGYHLLDSLVVFAGVGDRVRIAPADGFSLTVTGPRAQGVPKDDGNLCLKAARLFDELPGAAIELEKHLPAAGGIGGGSSDAAAVVRLLSTWAGRRPAAEALLALGADVPVCLETVPQRMSGIGERLTTIPALPPLWLVLVNAGVPVPTGAVFSALKRRDNPPMGELPAWPDAASLADWLRATRNDLEPPARQVAPGIGEVLEAIAATPDCLLARMSGSGGTCFGLYATEAAARGAAEALERPGWWVAAAPVLGAGGRMALGATPPAVPR